jgi:phosphatidylglycerophosphatase A
VPERALDTPPASTSTLDRVAIAVATVCGAGRAPIAPGTVASAITVVVLALVPFTQTALIGFFVVVTLGGIWASQRAERGLGAGKDPGTIVVDEVAGMTLSVLLLPLTWPVLLAGFVLFRIFDVVKPFPANVSQRLPGGLGVMADDLIAGVYALVILVAMRSLVGWP